ncbi:UNKNOWN [Stylonychia lemnae]|uniref:Transmembrane protein n=1 Tax=Stylonychia lemnae TaxID=5949 RepID=A0A078BA17_STYLE|nr:UNKNOWN [Stylonychia lemnae]|eukprot:CDW91264.1 UNKNOWN [Stylonychia lemnae]
MTYVFNNTMQQVKINISENLLDLNLTKTYRLESTMFSGFQTDLFELYLDQTQKILYLRDVKINTILPSIIQIRNDRLLYGVQRKLNASDTTNYDLVVCTYNLKQTGICNIYEIYAKSSPISYELKTMMYIDDNCIENLQITRQYLILGCSAYQNGLGRIQVFQRFSNFTMKLMLFDTGMKIASKNYTNIGQSTAIQYHNQNHTTIFYSSTTETKIPNASTSMNVTWINSIQLLNLNDTFAYQLSINQFRQKANDIQQKGKLQYDIYNNTMMLFTFEALIKLIYCSLKPEYSQSIYTFKNSKQVIQNLTLNPNTTDLDPVNTMNKQHEYHSKQYYQQQQNQYNQFNIEFQQQCQRQQFIYQYNEQHKQQQLQFEQQQDQLDNLKLDCKQQLEQYYQFFRQQYNNWEYIKWWQQDQHNKCNIQQQYNFKLNKHQQWKQFQLKCEHNQQNKLNYLKSNLKQQFKQQHQFQHLKQQHQCTERDKQQQQNQYYKQQYEYQQYSSRKQLFKCNQLDIIFKYNQCKYHEQYQIEQYPIKQFEWLNHKYYEQQYWQQQHLRQQYLEQYLKQLFIQAECYKFYKQCYKQQLEQQFFYQQPKYFDKLLLKFIQYDQLEYQLNQYNFKCNQQYFANQQHQEFDNEFIQYKLLNQFDQYNQTSNQTSNGTRTNQSAINNSSQNNQSQIIQNQTNSSIQQNLTQNYSTNNNQSANNQTKNDLNETQKKPSDLNQTNDSNQNNTTKNQTDSDGNSIDSNNQTKNNSSSNNQSVSEDNINKNPEFNNLDQSIIVRESGSNVMTENIMITIIVFSSIGMICLLSMIVFLICKICKRYKKKNDRKQAYIENEQKQNPTQQDLFTIGKKDKLHDANTIDKSKPLDVFKQIDIQPPVKQKVNNWVEEKQDQPSSFSIKLAMPEKSQDDFDNLDDIESQRSNKNLKSHSSDQIQEQIEGCIIKQQEEYLEDIAKQENSLRENAKPKKKKKLEKCYICGELIENEDSIEIQFECSHIKIKPLYTIAGNKTNCRMLVSRITAFQCEEGIELHYLAFLLSQGGSSSYTNNVKINQKAVSTHTYQEINNNTKVSFLIGNRSSSYIFDVSSNTIKNQTNETFRIGNVGDLLVFEIFLLYRDTNLDFFYFTDRKTMLGSQQFKYKNYKLSYEAQKVNEAELYNFFACTNNVSASDNQCFVYQVNATVNLAYKLLMNQTIGDMCAQSIQWVQNTIVISCPEYNSKAGRIDFYILEIDYSLSLLYSWVGNITERQVGISFHLFEYTSNHFGLFYQSFSQLDKVQLHFKSVLRFFYAKDGKYYYSKKEYPEIFKIDDSLARVLQVSLAQDRVVMMKYLDSIAVYQTLLCTHKQIYVNGACVNLGTDQLALAPSASTASTCYVQNEDYQSFDYLLRVFYCTNSTTFDPNLSNSVIQEPNPIASPNLTAGDDNKLLYWQILLIVIGCTLFLILLIILILCCCCRDKNKAEKREKVEMVDTPDEEINKRPPVLKVNTGTQSPSKNSPQKDQQTQLSAFDGPYNTNVKFYEDDNENIQSQQKINQPRRQNYIIETEQEKLMLTPKREKGKIVFDNRGNINKDQQQRLAQDEDFDGSVILTEVIDYNIDLNSLSGVNNNQQEFSKIVKQNSDKQFIDQVKLRSITKMPRDKVDQYPTPDKAVTTRSKLLRAYTQKQYIDLIKEDPRLKKEVECAICNRDFTMQDRVVKLLYCKPNIQHLAHGICIKRLIDEHHIKDLECWFCKKIYKQQTKGQDTQNDDTDSVNFFENDSDYSHQINKLQIRNLKD